MVHQSLIQRIDDVSRGHVVCISFLLIIIIVGNYTDDLIRFIMVWECDYPSHSIALQFDR